VRRKNRVTARHLPERCHPRSGRLLSDDAL
jgi:hypothetical protein